MEPLTQIEKQEKLPYSKGWPIVGGALLGIALRLVYAGDAKGP